MKKVGILLDNLGANDQAFDFITSIEHIDRETDVIGFYLTPARACVAPKFAILESYLSYSYDGALVGVNLSTADRLIKASTSRDRWLYLWELSHLFQGFSFQDLWNLFNSDTIKIVVRSEEIAQGLERTWGRKPKVAKNFKELINLVGEKNE